MPPFYYDQKVPLLDLSGSENMPGQLLRICVTFCCLLTPYLPSEQIKEFVNRSDWKHKGRLKVKLVSSN